MIYRAIALLLDGLGSSVALLVDIKWRLQSMTLGRLTQLNYYGYKYYKKSFPSSKAL